MRRPSAWFGLIVILLYVLAASLPRCSRLIGRTEVVGGAV